MINPQISFLEKIGKKPKPVLLEQILIDIGSEKYKPKIDQIRSFINIGKIEDAQKVKKSLPAFIASGQFSGGHKKENFLAFSGVINLDFDKIDPKTYYDVFTKASSIKTTLSCF